MRLVEVDMLGEKSVGVVVGMLVRWGVCVLGKMYRSGPSIYRHQEDLPWLGHHVRP